MKSLFLMLTVLLLGQPSWAQGQCTLQIEMTGAIGAGVSDFFDRALHAAQEKNCSALLVTINTPGGSLQTTRILVERILASPIPVLCLVYPPGGHAGSAGAIILQACHIAGAVETTNIGAATPIVGTGEELKGDLRNKMMNDTISWLEGITELRGRSKKFSKDIVESAKAVEAKTAKEIGAIDILAKSLDDFLEQSRGREVKMNEGKVQKVEPGPVIQMPKDLRANFLDLIANPQIAYLLFMGSLALLYFEITHPGTMVPGVLGGLGLLLAMISFHVLDVQWGGLALLLLGLGLLVAEAFVPSFGILGIGGIAAFVFGGLLLFSPEVTGGLALSLALVLPTAVGAGGLMLWVGYFAARAMKTRRKSGADLLLGGEGIVFFADSPRHGQVEISGEIWQFESKEDLQKGDHVLVEKIEGLKAFVRKKEI